MYGALYSVVLLNNCWDLLFRYFTSACFHFAWWCCCILSFLSLLHQSTIPKYHPTHIPCRCHLLITYLFEIPVRAAFPCVCLFTKALVGCVYCPVYPIPVFGTEIKTIVFHSLHVIWLTKTENPINFTFKSCMLTWVHSCVEFFLLRNRIVTQPLV